MWLQCSKCGKYKALWAFSKGRNIFNTHYRCKKCRRQDYLDNKKHYLDLGKQWSQDNKEYRKYQNKEWSKNNRDKRSATWAKYYTSKVFNTRELTKQELDDIKLYYILSNYLSSFGILHEVDHCVPLSKGGLHHSSNLQVITLRDNRSKGAKLDYKYQDEVYKL